MKDYKTLLDKFVSTVVAEGGSDLHLSEGRHPSIRVFGDLIPIQKEAVLTKEDTIGLLSELLSDKEREVFLEKKDIDFSYSHNDSTRLRSNAFFQKGAISIAMRLIPRVIKTLEELNLLN